MSRPNRQKTAIRRTKLSVPVRLAIENKIITLDTTVHDYGCGRCDDLNMLSEVGISATGHDTNFGKKQHADVVLLTYVINVIEDQTERKLVLKDALSLAKTYLIVSARTDQSSLKNAIPYGDGVLSKSNTFQKFYSNTELQDYITSVTGLTPTKLSNGIFFVKLPSLYNL